MKNNSTLPSICIPRVLNNISRYDIINTFESILGKGSVSKVDMIYRQDMLDGHYRVFVHFSNNCINNSQYEMMSSRLLHGADIKIVYSKPWFWKCSVSRAIPMIR
jgi:hypothetical protein